MSDARWPVLVQVNATSLVDEGSAQVFDVIEEKAAVAQFIDDLAGASVLYIRIRSLNAGRTTAEFRLDGSAAAVQAAFASCPVTGPQKRTS